MFICEFTENKAAPVLVINQTKCSCEEKLPCAALQLLFLICSLTIFFTFQMDKIQTCTEFTIFRFKFLYSSSSVNHESGMC